MKHSARLPIQIIALFLVLTASTCNKNPELDPNAMLPPATQIGANTFGCLINGQVFLPYEPFLSGKVPIEIDYQPSSDGYHLYINAVNNSANFQSVGLFADSVTIMEGQTYALKSRKNGNASAASFLVYLPSRGSQNYLLSTNDTTARATGQLHISKFKMDSTRLIISGTFWFNAFDNYGDSVNVTEGRFDL